MTHELKTPVASISLASQMLNDPAVTKSPKMLEHISNIIKDETKRLTFQVDKVLQMSVFERENIKMELQENNINEIIQTIAENYSLKIHSKGGNLYTDLQAHNAFVNIDEMHFGNIIYNLLDNAVKYSREDTPIIIMDEPMSALDFGNQAHVLQLILDLQQEGKTIIFTTHNPNHALTLQCNVAIMENKQIIQHGDYKTILNTNTLKKIYGNIIELDNLPHFHFRLTKK